MGREKKIVSALYVSRGVWFCSISSTFVCLFAFFFYPILFFVCVCTNEVHSYYKIVFFVLSSSLPLFPVQGNIQMDFRINFLFSRYTVSREGFVFQPFFFISTIAIPSPFFPITHALPPSFEVLKGCKYGCTRSREITFFKIWFTLRYRASR